MKHLKTGLLMMSIVAMTVACKKDKEETPPPAPQKKNEVAYDGSKHKINGGFIQDYGSWGGSSATNLDLILYTEDLVFTFDQDGVDSVSGEGHLLYFEMWSNTATHFEAGKYEINGQSEANGISSSAFVMNFTVQAPQNATEVILISGEVNIKRDGNNYEIDITATTQGNKELKAYFKGSIASFEGRIEPENKDHTVLNNILTAH